MLNVICRYIDKDRNEKVSIWSREFIKTCTKQSLQVIEVLWFIQTEEQREILTTLSQQELYDTLCCIIDKNRIKVLMPN